MPVIGFPTSHEQIHPDELHLQHVGTQQHGFLDGFGGHVLPQLDAAGVAS